MPTTLHAFSSLRGAADSPVLLHVPHTGTWIPPHTRAQFLLDDWQLDLELRELTDAHTDHVARDAADLAAHRPHALINHVSRFVVDPERLPDDREEMAAVGMAAVYTRGTRGQQIRHTDPRHQDELLDTYYTTWADAVTAHIQNQLARTGHAVLLDIHSYPSRPLPYELRPHDPRPAICLGTDPAHTPAWLVDAAQRAFAPANTVALNTPFAGTYVPLTHYRRDPRVHSLMLEIRRDIYMTEPGGPVTLGAALLPVALAHLIDDVTAHLQAAH